MGLDALRSRLLYPTQQLDHLAINEDEVADCPRAPARTFPVAPAQKLLTLCKLYSVLFRAGGDADEIVKFIVDGGAFAARVAETIFTAHRTLASAQEFY